jgi:hypothetical protein
MTTNIPHWANGQEFAGTAGNWADVANPATSSLVRWSSPHAGSTLPTDRLAALNWVSRGND